VSAHNTESAPPPPFNPDELKALGDRIGAAIKEAVGGPLPGLPRPLQYIVGRVLLRLGLEVRALAQHAGLHTPEREHAVLTPDFRTFRRLLTTATPELERLPRGLELHWLLSLLEVELQLAEETQRRAHAVLHRARLFFPLDPTTRPFLATAPGGL
jgi:hypothetical protein